MQKHLAASCKENWGVIYLFQSTHIHFFYGYDEIRKISVYFNCQNSSNKNLSQLYWILHVPTCLNPSQCKISNVKEAILNNKENMVHPCQKETLFRKKYLDS